jgi:pimeloyl-ACP methyl ester carboxylesterase
VVLPHGYLGSSFQFRHFMAALGDRWRLIAPDLPGFGYSGTPDPGSFDYTFAGYGEFPRRFVDALGLDRYVIYLHDYGSQHGFRLAMNAPERVAGLIIQNGEIYEDVLGPKYGWQGILGQSHPGGAFADGGERERGGLPRRVRR